jgi:transposase
MGQAVVVTREDLTAAALRQHARRCRDGRVACRALAMAPILEGATHTQAAAACGMDRQTLRDLVHRYNADGLAGLRDAPRGGRPAVLSGEQMAELKALVLAGPDLAKDGVVRRRCLDLRSVIETRFQVTMHERRP